MQYSNHFSRRKFIKTLGTVALSTSLFSPAAMAEIKNLVVVELFTSQGCSSCPPADKLLGELAKKPNIVALSLNVDYWDYLGWRDTLGSPENSRRQKLYAHVRGKRQVYTPQMIINGDVDIVGSRRKEVLNEVARQETLGGRIDMTMSDDKDQIVINVAASPDSEKPQSGTIWLMVTSPQITVPIKRGENIGKKIVYHNVVRQMIPAGMWNGKAIRLVLPKAGLDTSGERDCVALLQQGKLGKVLGVAGLPNISH